MLVDAAPASHGAEARDLEAGARVVTLIQSDGRKVFQRVVLLSADERVELDLEEINAEVWRGKVKPKAAVDAAKVPALIDVVVIDRQVRVLLDGQPMPFDDVRERYQATVDAGEHRLEATVSGRVRSASTVRVAGRPWRCVASVEGALRCDEVADLDALPPLEVAALNQRLRTLAPRLRAQAIIDEVGRADGGDDP